ncbi:glycosyl hydrolase 115 family protein [Sinomicrobium sp. M5D2P9]
MGNQVFNRVLVVVLLTFFPVSSNVVAQEKRSFIISSAETTAQIICDKNEGRPVHTAAQLFADDVYRISGQKAELRSRGNSEYQVKAGTLGVSEGFDKACKEAGIDTDKLRTKLEGYVIKAVTDAKGKKNILFIAGSDPVGTAHGLMELSRRIGVSPWYWWADVQPEKKEVLEISGELFVEEAPKVKFRGIFINDEDWGLQPWAAKTFEPGTGDIGPETYKKVFELLLRLKANTIWPAMHPSTRAFFHYPGNAETAKAYGITVGTSHAEPMLRNNVDEWNKSERGAFNYQTNKEQVYAYWEERVKESKGMDAYYTLGMRGIHDSGMEGVESKEDAVSVLEGVIKDQRGLLKKYLDQDVEEIPQAFTAYKEVLDIYDAGLEVPEDVTMVWPDDNYGYIRRLGNAGERKRPGGAGVYYHASYWGRPHDYLWLSTTPPALIREEMWKAYKTGADRLWILNVGDIKPAEYTMQLFMDMAYDTEAFRDTESLDIHRKNFYTSIFGSPLGDKISELRKKYYDLSFERKPEYMGWSQTEPTTEVHETGYDPFAWGDEVGKRLNAYKKLGDTSDSIYNSLPKERKDTYFQLVHYPVKGAMFMNMKYLYRDLALKYNREGRLIAEKYKDLSLASHDSIAGITKQYNTGISDGKWNHMMNMAPRDLPVFKVPEIMSSPGESGDLYGYRIEDRGQNGDELPFFYAGQNDRYFVDVFLKREGNITWSVRDLPEWIKVSQPDGKLSSGTGELQQRIYFEVDGKVWERSGRPSQSKFVLKLDGEDFPVDIRVRDMGENPGDGFLEKNGMAVAYAGHFSSVTGDEKYMWKGLQGLGHSGNAIQAFPIDAMPLDTINLKDHPKLTYHFITETVTEDAKLFLFALPTHPLTRDHKVRVGVQWDDGPIRIVNFQTHGRSERWKENVLKNLAGVDVPVTLKKKGKHRLSIYMIDPGVTLDFYYLQTEGQTLPYSVLPETRIVK